MSNLSSSPEPRTNSPNVSASGLPVPVSVLQEILSEQDFKIKAQDGHVHVHKALLQHYFRQGGKIGESTTSMEIPDYPARLVKSFVDLLYGYAPGQIIVSLMLNNAEVSRTAKALLLLLDLADKVKADAITDLLIQQCNLLEVQEVTMKDIVDIYSKAHILQLQSLKNTAIKLLKLKPEGVLKGSTDLLGLFQDKSIIGLDLIYTLCTPP